MSSEMSKNDNSTDDKASQMQEFQTALTTIASAVQNITKNMENLTHKMKNIEAAKAIVLQELNERDAQCDIIDN